MTAPGAPRTCTRCGLATVEPHAITDDLAKGDECLDALRTALGPFLVWGEAEVRESSTRLAREHLARTHARALARLLIAARPLT